MPLEKEERDIWINAIVAFAKNIQRKNLNEHGRFIPSMLREKAGLYLFNPTNLQVVQENIEALIKSSNNKSNDAGALAWRFLRACVREDGSVDFKLQYKMVDILARTNFDRSLTAKEKLKLINFVGYTYGGEAYQLLHDKLGNISYSQDTDNLAEEKKLTVKIFHLLLDELKKVSKGKSNKKYKTLAEKISLARSFLESVARNGDILYDASYNEVKDRDVAGVQTPSAKRKRNKKVETGKVLTISSDDRKELFEYMKVSKEHMEDSKVKFSEECVDYFERGEECDDYLKYIEERDDYSEYIEECEDCFEQNDDQIDPVTYLRIVMNKMKLTHDNEQRKNIETSASEKLSSLLEKGLREDEKQGKETVLKVAQAYAKAQNGAVFHEQMTTIFRSMVAYHDYSVADVDKLCDALDNRGSDKMQKMIKAIRDEYAEYHMDQVSLNAWRRKGRY